MPRGRRETPRHPKVGRLGPSPPPEHPGAAKLRSITSGETKISLSRLEKRFHNSRHSWEQDGKRERQAYARGDDFRRYTWGDVFERPRLMLAELRAIVLGPVNRR
jgi:hypothetical protein